MGIQKPGLPVTSCRVVGVQRSQGPKRRSSVPRPQRPSPSFLSVALLNPGSQNRLYTNEPTLHNAMIEWGAGFGCGAGFGGMAFLPFAAALAQNDMQFLGLAFLGAIVSGMAGTALAVGLQAMTPAERA